MLRGLHAAGLGCDGGVVQLHLHQRCPCPFGCTCACGVQGKALVAFERHLALRSKGGNHCHINTMPVSKAAAASARDVFESHASTAGASMQHIPAAPGGKLDRYVLLGPGVGGRERQRVWELGVVLPGRFWRPWCWHSYHPAHQSSCSFPPCRAHSLGCRHALQQLVGRGEYFLALLPDGAALVHPLSK